MGDVREASRQVTSAQVRGIKLEDQLGPRRDMFGGGVSARGGRHCPRPCRQVNPQR